MVDGFERNMLQWFNEPDEDDGSVPNRGVRKSSKDASSSFRREFETIRREAIPTGRWHANSEKSPCKLTSSRNRIQ